MLLRSGLHVRRRVHPCLVHLRRRLLLPAELRLPPLHRLARMTDIHAQVKQLSKPSLFPSIASTAILTVCIGITFASADVNTRFRTQLHNAVMFGAAGALVASWRQHGTYHGAEVAK